jgi:hypothetical protein
MQYNFGLRHKSYVPIKFNYWRDRSQQSERLFVTFIANGRTGNNLFQYLVCKIIQKKYGQTYVPIGEIENVNDMLMQSKFGGNYYPSHLLKDLLVVRENDLEKVLSGSIDNLNEKNIICIGYFQKSEFYLPYRNYLIESLKNCDEYWLDNDNSKKRRNINNYFQIQHNQSLNENDVVISLRLDDFIIMGGEKSNILPPEYYFDILEKETRKGGRLFIVSDKIQLDWEKKYVEYFQKWNPIMVSEDLETDFALMRDCPILIHSNSTLCWMASFLSEKKTKRYIPKTNYYINQSLNKIDENDTLIEVKTMEKEKGTEGPLENLLFMITHP